MLRLGQREAARTSRCDELALGDDGRSEKPYQVGVGMTRRRPTPKPPKASRTARLIGMPDAQANRDDLVLCDAPHFTEADQRHAMRSKQMLTVKRLSRVELMRKANVITTQQASACTWYAIMHELAFEFGQGTTANYGGVGACGGLGWDHGARSLEQGEARRNIAYARLGIPAYLIGQFEIVLLGKGPPPQMMTKADKAIFSLAAFRLHEQVAHMLTVAA